MHINAGNIISDIMKKADSGNEEENANANDNRRENANASTVPPKLTSSNPSASSSYVTGWEYETKKDKMARQKYYKKLLEGKPIMEMSKLTKPYKMLSLPSPCKMPPIPKLSKMPSMPNLCNSMAHKMLCKQTHSNFNDEYDTDNDSTKVEVSHKSDESESDSENDLSINSWMENEGGNGGKSKGVWTENANGDGTSGEIEVEDRSIFGGIPSASSSHIDLINSATIAMENGDKVGTVNYIRLQTRHYVTHPNNGNSLPPSYTGWGYETPKDKEARLKNYRKLMGKVSKFP
ncbi:hypothetical protein niasHT_032186 [Heterodera trifolii]|uniref:Uncharacterized protein n=1 Tax=Heterodera trifolii TaxID=157864 RepID=A0ABD2HUY6_9BILA